MARPGLLHTISSVLNHEGFTPRPVTGPGRTPATPLLRIGVAVAVLAAIVWGAHWLHTAPDRGAAAAFSLLIGAAFGVIMQRGRFCFFCIFRDYIEHKDSRPFYSVLSALAVGSVCY